MADTTNAQKYKGYDLDSNSSHRRRKNQPWFWKVLGISLLLTIIILAGVVFGVLHKTHKNAKHMEEINAANNIEALLKDHKNVTITTSYSHLAEGSDYTTTRQVRKDKKDDYEQECVKSIEDSVFQGDTKDQLQNEKERDNTITLQLTTKVQASDEYATTYGFSVGDTIEKTITMDKKTQIVTSVEEKCGDEVFYGYNVEFDGQKKVPVFYQKLEKEKRVCTVYSDYNGENNQEYTYNIPVDVYFTVLDHEGYKVYEDENGNKEFTEYQMQIQNPETDLSLYVKTASSK